MYGKEALTTTTDHLMVNHSSKFSGFIYIEY